MQQVITAKIICRIAHMGQKDKGGKPYYLHPFTVAEMCKTDREKTVAYLHDVVEDTWVSIDKLRRMGFDDGIIEAVDCLTKKDGLDYETYINQVKANPLARAVKINDMRHNSDLSRLRVVTPRDVARADKYKHYIKYLMCAEAL